MKTRLRLLSLLALVFTLFACGAAPEPTESVTEPLLVPLVMHVMPGTLQMVSPKGRLSESSTQPTPLLTLVTVISNGPTSLYSTTACQAIVSVPAAQFASVNAMLATPGHTVDVHLTYDNSGTATNKPVTAVSFTLI